MAVKITVLSTEEFEIIDGKPHRVWIGKMANAVEIRAYIHHVEVTGQKLPVDFDADLKRIETKPE